MKSLTAVFAVCGCFLGTGALLGALVSSEGNRPRPFPIEQRFPAACEKYVTAYEACGVDARTVSARLSTNGLMGESMAPYIQRQLSQLRLELAQVRAKGGEDALVAHCHSSDFEDINYELVRQVASSLLEVNAMEVHCARAVGTVIETHSVPQDIETTSPELDASSAASILVVPKFPEVR